MSVEIPNKLLAYGSVSSAGAKVSGAGFVPAQSAKGVYTLTLDEAVDATQCACIALERGATGLILSVDQTSDTVKTVNVFTALGAAADSDFDFLVLRAPG